jgi:ribonuclease G
VVVGETPSRAEMATRRGGRGRRRPGGSGGPASPKPTDTVEADAGENGDAQIEQSERGRRSSGNGGGRTSRRGAEPLISELLHEGQEIIVQIAKEPIAKKGARITSHLVLPGRFLVYMPTVNRVGVSRKVGSETERARLKKIVSGLREREPGPGGFIARTAAVGQSEEDLLDDMRYLQRTWADIKLQSERRKAPSLLHRDLDLIQRILRDQISDDFSAIRVDNELEYARIVDFVNRVQPKLVRRVKLHTRDESILESYGVQAEIDKAVKPRVWLKSGGYIVINQTEALVSIDVNTGKFVGKSDRLEDTITRTNMEAVKEIVRQVRLRDLGGIIVIDFIDMEERRNRMKVAQALEQELRADRSPSKVLGFNDFGLIIITRKRVKQSLERTLCSPCPYCQGAGLVKSTQTMAFEILSEARRLSKQYANEADDITLRVSPEVAHALRSSEAAIFEEIEAHFTAPVRVKIDHELHQEQFDFAIL